MSDQSQSKARAYAPRPEELAGALACAMYAKKIIDAFIETGKCRASDLCEFYSEFVDLEMHLVGGGFGGDFEERIADMRQTWYGKPQSKKLENMFIEFNK